MTESILRRFVRGEIDPRDQATRTRVGLLEAWVSIISNTLLAALKLGLGLWLNSISVLADALHTASDVVSSVVVMVGFRAARLPADEQHPYGHARVENVATLVIAVLLVIAGLEFAGGSVRRLFSAEPVRGSYTAAAILALSGVFKEWLARFAVALGRLINSSVLIADAWHHRSDAVASILVAIAIVASRFGYPWVDAASGLLVSGLVIYTGYQLGRGAASVLIGERADPAVVDQITSLATGVSGVENVHGISVHDYGGGQTLVSLHIRVDEGLHVRESHGIAEDVEATLENDLGVQATVHVEPYSYRTR